VEKKKNANLLKLLGTIIPEGNKTIGWGRNLKQEDGSSAPWEEFKKGLNKPGAIQWDRQKFLEAEKKEWGAWRQLDAGGKNPGYKDDSSPLAKTFLLQGSFILTPRGQGREEKYLGAGRGEGGWSNLLRICV